MDGLSRKRDIKIDGCFLDLHEGPIRIGKYLSFCPILSLSFSSNAEINWRSIFYRTLEKW
jgi:hypothetical protein